jgi:hypothetical protein
MSTLANNSQANPGNSFYALATESGSLWYNFPSETGEVLLNDASGTQVLKSVGADLFFNDELLAKASDLQDIADWSLYPALASVNMDGFSITDISDVVVNNTITTNVLDATSITNQSNIVTATLQIAGEPVPSLGQITTNRLAASGAVTAGSVSTTGSIGGGSLSTSGGLDMSNTAISRASTVNISNSGFAPYGALTSPDGVALTWNGAAITTGAGGNASQWANYPAVTSINANSNDINNAGTVNSGNVIIGGGTSGLLQTSRITTLSGPGAPGLQVTAYPGLSVTADAGNITTTAGAVSGTGNISTTAKGVITDTAYGELHNITNNFEVTCDGGLNPITTPNINLVAKNGNGGQINITADPGSVAALGGAINITANGGTVILPTDPPTSVTVGGEVNIFANTGSGGLYTLTSAVNIAAAGVNSYAGAIPPVGSLAGYNFIYGTGGVSICAGLPSSGFQLPLTTYLYGVGSLGFTGVRLESPNGIGMLSPVYATDIYPFDGTDLTIQGRSAPSANVVIKDCSSLTTTPAGSVITDFVNSLSGLGIFYKDSLYPQTSSEGLYANFLRPPIASAPGVPNLVITNNPFAGNTNYVDISGANAIAFDATSAGALSGVKSINGAAWPPPTGDASLWSQYPATSIIDVSGYGLSNVGDISGVVLINGSVYPPVVDDVADWATFPAVQNVDISGYEINNVNNISMPANGTIISAGQLSIFSDAAGDLSLAANGGGNVNIGTGNAGSIFIQTVGAGHDLSLAGDTTTITAAVKLTVDTPSIDVVGADIQNVSNITNDATNLLTVQSTANLTVSAETALTLVSDSADVTVQGQTGIAVYAATGNVTITADSGEVVVQDSVLNVNSHKITNVTNGTAAADAVNYSQLTFRDNTEFYVSGQGSDSNNGSILAPFLTIQAAITAAELISSASSICNINVASGNYPQSLTFNKGYVVLNGTLQSQTGNEVCEITGSITINCTGANDVFNRQVAFQGFNITCGAGQSITNTSASSHTVSFQDCKIFVNSVCYNSTATCADARTYFTNVEIFSTNAANVSPVITTNVGLVELERLDFTVDGNAIGVLIGGTSVLNRFSLSTLEATNTAATLLPLLSITSTTTSPHSLGNVAFAFTSAVAKTATNAVYINSGINTAIIALNCVFTLAGTASSTNNCIGYSGVGSPTIAGVNNTSLNVNVLLPQTVSVQSGITQIQYTDINPPNMACYSTTGDQAFLGTVNTPQVVTFNTTQFQQGTALVATSRFYVSSQGNYQITWSLCFSHSSGTALVTSFLKKNGTTVANTGSQSTTFSGSSSLVQVSPNFILSLNAGDYVELWWNSNALGSSINSTGAINNNPATPGAVFNITQIR